MSQILNQKQVQCPIKNSGIPSQHGVRNDFHISKFDGRLALCQHKQKSSDKLPLVLNLLPMLNNFKE